MILSPDQTEGIRSDAMRALARIHDPVLRKDVLGLDYLRGLGVDPEGRLVLDLALPTPAHPGAAELRATVTAKLGRLEGVRGVELRFGYWVMGYVGPRPKRLGQVKNPIAVAGTGGGRETRPIAEGLACALAACGSTAEWRPAAGSELEDIGPADLDYLLVDVPGVSVQWGPSPAARAAAGPKDPRERLPSGFDLTAIAGLAADTPFVGLALVVVPDEAGLAAAREALKACKARGVAVLGLIEHPSSPLGKPGRQSGENGPVDKLALREGLAFLGGIPADAGTASAKDLDHAARQLAGRVLAHNHAARANWHRPDEVLFRDMDHLEILWHDGHRSAYPFVALREACCCARCRDEWSGRRLLQPGQVRPDVRVLSLEEVGNYALNFQFSDGHNSGIYGFQYLRGLCGCGECGAGSSGAT